MSEVEEHCEFNGNSEDKHSMSDKTSSDEEIQDSSNDNDCFQFVWKSGLLHELLVECGLRCAADTLKQKGVDGSVHENGQRCIRACS